MKVLLIGSGGREHALAKLITSSQDGVRLYVLSDYNNPGLGMEAEGTGGRLFVGPTTSPQLAVEVASKVSPDLVVVGPEEPQFHGVADSLRERGYIVFGAGNRCSRVERDKAFARQLLWKYGIRGRLNFSAFSSLEEVERFVKFVSDVVVKPARQVGGKGVRVVKDTKAYLSGVKSRVKARIAEEVFRELAGHGDSEFKVLVEQRVDGVEYTAQVITDGSYVLPLPLVQDYPHAFELDLGFKTGGMGSISGPGHLLPFINQEEYETTTAVVREVLSRLQEEVGDSYRGAFAGQMMLTGLWGPTIIEFYSRFGDPELSCLLPRVESGFLEALDRAARGALAGAKLSIAEDSVSVVKAVAPAGYPVSKGDASGHPVAVDEVRIRELGCHLLYASVEVGADGRLYTKGSRAFEVVCHAGSYDEAYRLSELAASYITSLDGWPLFHRSDVGSRWLIEGRARLAERVRTIYRSKQARGTLGESPDLWVLGEGVAPNQLSSTAR
jgi:phosphoribosylamine--glycine ligase